MGLVLLHILSQVLVTSCSSCRFQDLFGEVLFYWWGGVRQGDKSWLPKGGQNWGAPIPSCPVTHSSSVEELVWGGGIGDMTRGCVGQRALTNGWLWGEGDWLRLWVSCCSQLAQWWLWWFTQVVQVVEVVCYLYMSVGRVVHQHDCHVILPLRGETTSWQGFQQP